jgi:GTPase SAR1 family protein
MPLLNIISWDVGGPTAFRKFYRPYYDTCDGIIFVVDAYCSDEDQIAAAMEELTFLLNEKGIENVPVLLLANKMDIPGNNLHMIPSISPY